MATSHERPRHCDDRQIVGQALQGRIASRPADAIEKNVALADRRDELLLIEAREEHAVLISPQAEGGKGPIEALAEKFGDTRAFLILYEDELAITGSAGYAWKHVIELGQIFEKRLAAPIDGGG